jgi:ABC-type transport system involved in cytochrome bd biosynthesis fused ATPase/permease subunit
MEDHSEMRNDGEMEEGYSEMRDDGEMEACICCFGAYESFDSITSVLESKEKVAKKSAEKVAEIKRQNQKAKSKERIERQNRKAELKDALERTPQEKLMDAYFEKLRVEADEIEGKKKVVLL